MSDNISMVPEILGDKDFNTVFDIIKFIDDKQLDTVFFQRKDSLGRRYNSTGSYDNEKQWAMTGNADLHNKGTNDNTIMLEIKLDIPQAEIQQDNYDIEKSIIGELLNLDNIKNNPNNIIQVIQKVAEEYTLKNYKIEKTIDGLVLKMDSAGTMDKNTYKLNYDFSDSEFGIVTFITNINPLLVLFKEMSFISNTGDSDVLNFDKHFDHKKLQSDYGYKGAFLLATSIKTMMILFQDKGYYNFSDDVFSRLYFRTTRNSRSTINKNIPFSSISHPRLDTSKTSFEIINFPAFNRLSNRNFTSPMDKWAYNITAFISTGRFNAVHGFEVLDAKFNKEDISEKLNIIEESEFICAPAIFTIPNNNELSLESLKAIHLDMYNSQMDKMKALWDKTIATYKRIIKGGSIDEGFFALSFIKKYFVYDATNSYRLNQSMNNSMTSVVDFFTQNYMPYEDFFGNDTSTKFLRSISRIDSKLLKWENSRLENTGATFKQLDQKGYYNAHATRMLLYPNPDNFYISESVYGGTRRTKAKCLIIVNDSGNKQAWKKKTRLLIENLVKNSKGRVDVLIVEPSDKIELMMIKRIAKGNSSFIYYSEFEGNIEIKKPAARVVNTSIIYYDGDSFDTRVRKITSKKGPPSDLDPKATLFLEFVASNRKYTFNGSTFQERDFNYPVWNRLMQEFAGKEIILANKNSLVKYQEAYGEDYQTLESYLESEEITKDFKNIYNTYAFISPMKPMENMRRAASFASHEVFNILYSTRNTETIDLKKFWYLILNSLEPDMQILFELFTNIVEQYPHPSNNVRWYDVSSIIMKHIVRKPQLGDNTIDRLIYNKMPINPDSANLESASARLEGLQQSGQMGGYAQRAFDFEEFSNKYRELLEDSKNLNLDIEEISEYMDTLIQYYIYRWNFKVDMLNKGV